MRRNTNTARDYKSNTDNFLYSKSWCGKTSSNSAVRRGTGQRSFTSHNITTNFDYADNQTIHATKSAMAMNRTTLSQFRSVLKPECRSRYMDIPPRFTPQLGMMSTQPRNLYRRRKLNRILTKMQRISTSVDEGYTEKPVTAQSCRQNIIKAIPTMPKQRPRQFRRPKKRMTEKTIVKYTDETLEKLVNNDWCDSADAQLSMKEELLLGSMKRTFLCSNYLRFQPLLNVYDGLK